MYRVIIADDEPWVLRGLSRLIPWEELGFEIVGLAENGLLAWEMVLKHNPHLVLTDIRMPGLDGIGLIGKIRNHNKETRIVLISGYAEFEYAREALRLGVTDYLIKQVKRDDLYSTAQKIRKELDQRQQEREALDSYMEDLTDLLLPEKGVTFAEFWQKRGLNSDWPAHVFMQIRWSGAISWNERVCQQDDSCAVCIKTGKMAAFVVMGYQGELSSAVGALMDRLQEQQGRAAPYMGISNPVPAEGKICRAGEEADIALHSVLFFPGRQFCVYTPYSDDEIRNTRLPDLLPYIKRHDSEGIMSWLAVLERECRNGGILLDELAAIYAQIEAAVQKYDGKQHGETEGIRDFGQLIDSYSDGDVFFDALCQAVHMYKGAPRPIENKVIQKIMDVIDRDFAEELSIQGIGRQYGISQGYLSSLIKKETGHTFTEHVVERRMRLANELLRESNKSIGEISELVGYSDYYRFSKVYKKWQGVTPGTYRAEHARG